RRQVVRRQWFWPNRRKRSTTSGLLRSRLPVVTKTGPDRSIQVTVVLRLRFILDLSPVPSEENRPQITVEKDFHQMKFAASLFIAAACAASSFAADNVVRWQKVVGVITAPNVDNPVAGISAGTLPWNTRGGSVRVDLTTGVGSFDVEGLVLNGG